MGACSVASVEELAQVLLKQGDVACTCVERGASDDVAAALLAKADQLQKTGKRVRIVCPDAVSAERYREGLAERPSLDAAVVTTARDLALEIMGDDRVQDAVGRTARVIDENEYDVLMEDVKVSGLKPGRLREMLKFFYKSISACDDEQEGWLITAEEKAVWGILTENLEARRALLACELSSMAYRGLQAAGVESEPTTLIVDDYGSLGKATQRLVRHVATDGIVAVGSTLAASNAEESYPCFEGFDELACASDERIELSTARPAASRRNVSLENPEAEFSFVASSVQERIEAGMAPRDILVAVPNAIWGDHIKAALETRGIAAAFASGKTKIKGDPRSEGRFADLKLTTFLRLYLDPSDFVSLRSWLGFGDWLLCSDAFLELMAFSREREISVPEAIALLRAMPAAARPTKVFGKLDAPLDELEELMDACRTIGRDDAVALFEAHGMPLAPWQIGLLGDDAAHADIERLARAAASPKRPSAKRADANSCVTIAPYRLCHGRISRITFITGLVNGFLPGLDAVDDKYTVDHRRVALAREQLLFLDLIATALDEALCTRFECDRLENASALHMQTARVFMKDGMRYAAAVPSEFASVPDDALASVPDVPRDLPTKVLCASSTL